MRTVFFIFVSMSVVAVFAAEDCQCPIDTHYKELGCTPVQGSGCCPERYDCSNLEGRSKDKCYINGQEFDIGSRISEEVMNAPCSHNCLCRQGFYNGSSAEITCAQGECFERYDPKCIYQYKLDSCCRDTKVCEAEKIAELTTCELDGKTYKEGERIYPDSSPCKKCICKKGFTGKIEEPFCKTISCGIVEHYTRRIESSCAPIFSSNGCCPNDWRCHEESDVIVSGSSSKSTDPNMTCKFGKKSLNVGDTFASNEECVTCGCFQPPLASCTRDAECERKRYERLTLKA